MSQPSQDLLDFAPSDARAGYRLQRFEVYNWGTFHDRVWSIEPGGDNALLTGDIGSGKSTLVDAVTTLLVPPQRITYNKAAGAEARERSLRTYVLGYYKSERGESGLSARSVSLRDHNGYSVILGYFYNAGFDRHVTLAQVFYMRRAQGQPERFYVIADRDLSIATDFAGFGTEIINLRKRLRVQPQVQLHETFPPYGAALRHSFGIDSDQALDLFNQTVSLKSVGNLTDFVRGHMLQAFPVTPRIEALIAHFDDLDRAHQAVLAARDQIAALAPLVDAADRYQKLSAEVTDLRDCRDALRPWFAKLKGELLTQRLARLDETLQQLASRLQRLTDQRRGHQTRRDELQLAIANNGGDRLQHLQAEIRRLQEQQAERSRKSREYVELAASLDLGDATDEASFDDNLQRSKQALTAAEDDEAHLQNQITEKSVALHEQEQRLQDVEAELASLRQRRSNLPTQVLSVRQRLCDDLSLPVESLPFAGELLQVRAEEIDWEGAIERVLHNFALSLLVPDEQYRIVADWVDRTHLRGRVVYYRVRKPRSAVHPELQPASLVRKLSIRPEVAAYSWLERNLAERFDYVCCTDLDEFRREQKAITRAGQIKAGGERHEKDDRHAIDDRARFVLGWSNEAKIAALEQQSTALAARVQGLCAEKFESQQRNKDLRERVGRLHGLANYRDFRDLDWRPITLAIQRAEEERRALEEGSDVLRGLQAQLVSVDQDLERTEQELTATQRQQATDEDKRSVADGALREAQELLAATPETVQTHYFPRLQSMRVEALGKHALTVESCDNRRSDMGEWLQARIDSGGKKISRLLEGIISEMSNYKTDWPVETAEADVSIEAVGEYRRMLASLQDDDLPRFEINFKSLLNENTIREVAGFQAQLNKERAEIRERIDVINHSLQAIDFNPSRYICLLAEPGQDADVRSFREDLRSCTEGALTGSQDEQYSEAKFLQVKAIIGRFRGREGQSDIDERWTRKVTDVRNWFAFSASERWREDDTEYEHYSDSGGKSGGQKEKLAYTVLAASLAYQFGLEWGEKRSRSFRFVVIDEAFGRGSDESTRFGLELFQRLNLQLLIVTPLQKIHVIERFVSSVGFVHCEDGKQSMLRHLNIEQYQAEKAARDRIAVQ
jgi:uncharacterized protein YPO0396